MNKFLKIYLILHLLWIACYSQKKSIAVDTYKSWAKVSRPGISNDGLYAYYRLDNLPIGSSSNVVLSTDKKWSVQFGYFNEPQFSKDSRKLYCMLPNDTLMMVDLKTHTVHKTSDIRSFKLFIKDNKEWIVACFKSANLVNFQNLSSNESFKFSNVQSYLISENGKYILLKSHGSQGNDSLTTITLVELSSKNEKVIYKGNAKVGQMVFDKAGNRVAFTANEVNGNTIYFYDSSLQIAKAFISENLLISNFKTKLPGENSLKFSIDGRKLFFMTEEVMENTPESDPNLIISSYRDSYLRNFQSAAGRVPIHHQSVINVTSGTIIELTNKYDELITQPTQAPDDYLVIESTTTESRADCFITYLQKKSYFICSTETGERIPIKIDSKAALQGINISPTGKYLIYYDQEKRSYFCYSIDSRKSYPVLSNKHENLVKIDKSEYPNSSFYCVGVAGWLPNDKSVLINGTYNIWQIDPEGKRLPINLTGKICQRDSIVYYVPTDRYLIDIHNTGSILISAFNLKNKDYALINFKLNQHFDKQSLTFKSIYTGELTKIYTNLSNSYLVKAKDTQAFLIRLETATNEPNYFFTRDLKDFSQLTALNQSRNYNWLRTELHNYEDSLGTKLEGIMYKPENFDSQKKYPVVLNYYEVKSNELNQFPSPDFLHGDIPIAWLVSNGYIVFKVNIAGSARDAGEAALRSINAAADYLNTFNWVNKTKIGISGHSFGGYETNFIVTHSKRFSVAVSAAGISNLIDFYGEMGDRAPLFVQYDQLKMIHSVVENPIKYIEKSPIVLANKVATPLLLVHNYRDDSVDIKQSLLFFGQLRHLKKKVWMLNYRNGDHGVLSSYRTDYYTKLSQFLDHYLMGKPMPDWMREHN
ncbi:dipeptidyl aminopeptidase/acylaminoacyl peptidase [Pedobacter sp. AK017]|uniref:alpha/beta hydrolase family protein n=1 Tax=Pedobacter sp. AK017 TaxID=2723073 RepID=UPI00161B3915|nr:prolyl oligopeptidase family serine peptidase [Pedobacter sp. AK017]MBB5441073.1 dipeptidyl aminopeptidase/acylaminoacyl peptidase [Pedobacter sp. AK017]